MPEIGDIIKGSEIGKTQPWNKFIWIACRKCGKQRWVALIRNKPRNIICQACAQKLDKRDFGLHWKGGVTIRRGGYPAIRIYSDDFFYSMVDHLGYILEHRLIMAKHLGRNLQPFEIVHHKNGIKDDNRIKNLQLTIRSEHSLSHNKGYQDGYQNGLIDGREKQIQELKEEIRLLRWELREANHVSK